MIWFAIADIISSFDVDTGSKLGVTTGINPLNVLAHVHVRPIASSGFDRGNKLGETTGINPLKCPANVHV